MSTPSECHFVDRHRVHIGSTWQKLVRWEEGDPIAAVDLTGKTIHFVIFPIDEDDNTPIADLTQDNDGISISETVGEFHIVISSAISSVQTEGDRYRYHLYAEYGDIKDYLLVGYIEFSLKVLHRV